MKGKNKNRQQKVFCFKRIILNILHHHHQSNDDGNADRAHLRIKMCFFFVSCLLCTKLAAASSSRCRCCSRAVASTHTHTHSCLALVRAHSNETNRCEQHPPISFSILFRQTGFAFITNGRHVGWVFAFNNTTITALIYVASDQHDCMRALIYTKPTITKTKLNRVARVR